MVNLSDFGSGKNIGAMAGRNKYGAGWLLRMIIYQAKMTYKWTRPFCGAILLCTPVDSGFFV